MLGEVPTSVTIPPISEPKAMGISMKDRGVPVRRDSCAATGISMASAPTFLVIIDRTVTAETSTVTCACAPLRLRSSGRIAVSTAPERATAAETRRAAATMITTSSPKPEKASSAGMMPIRTPVSSARRATRS